MHPHKIMQLQLHNRIPNCRSRTLPVIHTTPKYTCHLNMTSQIFLPLSKQRSQPAKVKKCNNTSLEGKYMLVAQSCVQTPSKHCQDRNIHTCCSVIMPNSALKQKAVAPSSAALSPLSSLLVMTKMSRLYHVESQISSSSHIHSQKPFFFLSPTVS